jgi:hypothetical protein
VAVLLRLPPFFKPIPRSQASVLPPPYVEVPIVLYCFPVQAKSWASASAHDVTHLTCLDQWSQVALQRESYLCLTYTSPVFET